MWMQRKFVSCPWARYADDAVIHCRTKSQALFVKAKLEQRMVEVGLGLHKDKTKIVYCPVGKIKDDQEEATSFNFLGFKMLEIR